MTSKANNTIEYKGYMITENDKKYLNEVFVKKIGDINNNRNVVVTSTIQSAKKYIDTIISCEKKQSDFISDGSSLYKNICYLCKRKSLKVISLGKIKCTFCQKINS